MKYIALILALMIPVVALAQDTTITLSQGCVVTYTKEQQYTAPFDLILIQDLIFVSKDGQSIQIHPSLSFAPVVKSNEVGLQEIFDQELLRVQDMDIDVHNHLRQYLEEQGAIDITWDNKARVFTCMWKGMPYLVNFPERLVRETKDEVAYQQARKANAQEKFQQYVKQLERGDLIVVTSHGVFSFTDCSTSLPKLVNGQLKVNSKTACRQLEGGQR